MFVLPLLAFVGCSSDDDVDVIPSVTKQLKSLDGVSFSYLDDLLVKTEDEEMVVTFEYSIQSKRSIGNNVKMTIDYQDAPEDGSTIDMTLNSKGYVGSCLQTYKDGRTDTWAFEYNANDQLVKMKRSEGENEVTVITYENGNITEVIMTSDEADEGMHSKISYTSDETPTPIKNTNGIMLFDITFGIDMDEMGFAYWAGLLGKATKQLPVKITYIDDPEKERIDTFKWLMKDNEVNKMRHTNDQDSYEFTFTWR